MIMNKKFRLSLVTIAASLVLISGTTIAILAQPNDLINAGAENKTYPLSLVSKKFLTNKYVNTTSGNRVNFTISNIMFYDDWQALTIPSGSGSLEASFSNSSPIQQIKSISVTWGSGNLFSYSNYTLTLKDKNKNVITSYTQGGLLEGDNKGTCNYSGSNAVYLSFTFTYTMAITNFVITYSCM